MTKDRTDMLGTVWKKRRCFRSICLCLVASRGWLGQEHQGKPIRGRAGRVLAREVGSMKAKNRWPPFAIKNAAVSLSQPLKSRTQSL